MDGVVASDHVDPEFGVGEGVGGGKGVAHVARDVGGVVEGGHGGCVGGVEGADCEAGGCYDWGGDWDGDLRGGWGWGWGWGG